MRKALIVGIDNYERIRKLNGCVNDATAVRAVLERHADGTPNFVTPKLLTAASTGEAVTKDKLKDAVRELFRGDSEIALFYFSGHGFIEETGGFLCTSECQRGDDGLALGELMTIAKGSHAKNTVIMLDSCHSG